MGNALRYWEIRRIVYNGVLVTITAGWIIVTWPHFEPAITVNSIPPVATLLLIMNACDCLAYLPEITLQRSPLRFLWTQYRWFFWLFGTCVGAALWYYWIADEIYPFIPH